jgi:hypothetical protein
MEGLRLLHFQVGDQFYSKNGFTVLKYLWREELKSTMTNRIIVQEG